MRSSSLIALFACAVTALAIAGCGDSDLPPDAVARVGGTVIPKDEFNQRAAGAAVQGMGAGGGQRIYDPPDFDACVAAMKANGPVAGGEPLPSDDELRLRCENAFKVVRETVMEDLIEREWLRQEGLRLNVTLGQRDVGRQLERYLERATESQREEYRAGVAGAGGKAAVIADLRNDQRAEELRRRAKQRAPKVIESDVQRYYEAHRSDFESPQTRDVRIVLTLDEARAERAREALRHGDRWDEVARRFSVDRATKARGGLIRDVKRGGLDDASIDGAVFAAESDVIEGPVESQFGWYVYEVVRVTGAEPRSLAEARSDIERRLRKQRADEALAQYNRELGDRYYSQTSCADEYKIDLCGDG